MGLIPNLNGSLDRTRVGKVPFIDCIIYFDADTLGFLCISYRYLLHSDKGTNPFLILDTRYTYRGCGIKTPDLPSNK